MFRAMRLEWGYGKEEVLALYASNAPFGGNVVGLDAAAWRYFGRRSDQLSWAEAATLAVLPNAPSLIFPGKNQELLLAKRNRVLQLLYTKGYFDSQTLDLAYAEPLPQKPFPLPQTATHLLNALVKAEGKGKRYHTTINPALQLQCNEIVSQHIRQLEGNLIHNAAVLIAEVETGNVVAYIGNASDAQNRFGNMVDIITAPRSTGSILKPFLYAAMLQDGLILPNSLVADVPVQFDGFAPKNYTENFDGAVPASLALSRSLNIPSVMMLRDYSYPRFYHLLKKLGFTHFTRPADHYGLSLILGGGEASLWDITQAYAAMGRTLTRYQQSNGKYFEDTYTVQHVNHTSGQFARTETMFPPLDAGSIWCTFKALLEVNRPETELGWEAYSSAAPIAWKTGTSFGNRDAWAVGTTPEYVVGVWVGNADGQGRPLLTGVTCAAPLMFDVFATLQHHSWFQPPYDDLSRTTVCRQSGHRPGMHCTEIDTILAPAAASRAPSCPYHQLIYTDYQKTMRLTASCATTNDMHAQTWFVLPPVQEYYYKVKHPEYAELPPPGPGCGEEESEPIGLIYPKSDAHIYLPKNFSGTQEPVVLHATHRRNDAAIYWHLDGVYLGETHTIHQMEISPVPGVHQLTLADEQGYIFEKQLTVIAK
jgi:penicillin-binding protein 1C